LARRRLAAAEDRRTQDHAMTAPRFVDLYRWDLRQVGRSPLLWTVLLILAASFIWGALNTAALHRAQTAAHLRVVAREAAHDVDLQRRIAAYRVAVTPDAPAIPYWQDPTSVSGFSQYLLFRHAIKPHLPLSPLAAGVSDVAPSWRAVKLNTVAGADDTYDFENPRGLALGRFDLGFALVYLLPVGLILIFGLLVTFERDHGMLRLAAAQATSPRIWVGARIAAILSWTLPTVLVALAIALALAGVSFPAAWPELVAALLLVACYVLFWTGIATLGLSRLPSAAAGVTSLAALWVLLTLGLPIAGAVIASTVDPAPSSSARVDLQRRTTDAVEADRQAILARAFAARADLQGAADQIGKLDYATRLTFLTPEIERRMSPLEAAIRAHDERQARLAELAGYAIPPLGFGSALATLAGTDAARQRDFERQARVYQQRLRDHLYPLVQREIADPTPRPEPALRGRFNFLGQGDVPAFTFTTAPAATRIGAVLPVASWLALIGAALASFGLIRANQWPTETA